MKKNTMCLFYLLTAAWLAVMFILSGQPAGESARLSGGLTRRLMDMLSFLRLDYETLEHLLRKAAHFAMFALLGALLYTAMHLTLDGDKGLCLKVCLPACVVVAALNEYAQRFSEGRSCEFKDVIIDSAGAFAGIGFAVLALHCYYLIKSRKHA